MKTYERKLGNYMVFAVFGINLDFGTGIDFFLLNYKKRNIFKM